MDFPSSSHNVLRKVYIEPTTKCNFSCHMCFRNSWFDEEFMDMPYDIFTKILATMPRNVQSIMFGGMGEPLLHARIFDMINACKAQGHKVELITNGALLQEESIAKLLHCKLDKLWISLDSLRMHEAQAHSLAGHPHMGQTLKAITLLNHKRGAHGHGIPTMALGIAFVLCEENLAQLKDLPSFIAKYYVDHVNVSHMKMESSSQASSTLYDTTLNMNIGSHTAQRPIVNIPYMDFHRADVQDALSGLFAHMNFTPHIGHMPAHRKTQYCKFIHEGMTFVRSDGLVSPCMELLHNGKTALGRTDRTIHRHTFGQVAELGLDSIWNSPQYVAFRQKVVDFPFSPCVHCGHCEDTESNLHDCCGNAKPCCGGCLWAEGLLSCP